MRERQISKRETLFAQQVTEQCGDIQRRIGAEKHELNASQAADYLNEVARVCFQISQQPLRTKEETLGVYIPVEDSLMKLQGRISKQEGDLKNFLGGAHGVNDVLSVVLHQRKWNPSFARSFFFYNGFHWGGVANILGAEPTLQNAKLRFQGKTIEFTADGKVKATPALVAGLARATPHLNEYKLGKFMHISARGRTELTPGQVFVVLRAASNSLHSLKMNVVLYRFRKALQTPGLIEKTLNFMSKPRNLSTVINRTFGKEYLRKYPNIPENIRDNPNAWEHHGAVHPEDRNEVLEDLHRNDIESFRTRHFNVLVAASKMPPSAGTLVRRTLAWGADSADMQTALEKADGKNRLFIKLNPETTSAIKREEARQKAKGGLQREHVVELYDTGLGKSWEVLSTYRPGSNTSGYLQKKTAKIKLKTEEHGATTQLIFQNQR